MFLFSYSLLCTQTLIFDRIYRKTHAHTHRHSHVRCSQLSDNMKNNNKKMYNKINRTRCAYKTFVVRRLWNAKHNWANEAGNEQSTVAEAAAATAAASTATAKLVLVCGSAPLGRSCSFVCSLLTIYGSSLRIRNMCKHSTVGQGRQCVSMHLMPLRMANLYKVDYDQPFVIKMQFQLSLKISSVLNKAWKTFDSTESCNLLAKNKIHSAGV